MANFSRALLNVGETLGVMAQSVGQRERDAALAMRDENMMRFQAKLRMEADDRQHVQNKEILGMQQTAEQQNIALRQAGDVGMEVRRQTYESAENAKNRQLQGGLAAASDAMQVKKWSRDDLARAEQGFNAQFQDIDSRLSEINDDIVKKKLDMEAAGTVVDEKRLAAITAPWQQEIAQLKADKKRLGQDRTEVLARLGHPNYKKLTPEEVATKQAMERSTARQGTPGAPHGGSPGTLTAHDRVAPPVSSNSKATMAAQASREVPTAPTPPLGMMERARKAALENKQARGSSSVGTGGTAGGRGAELRQAVAAIKNAVKAGRPVPADAKEALADSSQLQLTKVYGLSLDEMKAMGRGVPAGGRGGGRQLLPVQQRQVVPE